MNSFKTNWLNSKPVYYNEHTGKASHQINDVIDYSNLKLHEEGLFHYLQFGYSVFGQTMVENVKFLPPSAELQISDDKKITIRKFDDPADQWLGRQSHEDDVLDLFAKSIQTWEKSFDGPIVIPTSGGFDSRLLNYFIKDKGRIYSFTYGISPDQTRSYEAVYAQKLSKILGTKWEQIFLGKYNSYLTAWDNLFGPAVHAHGMYQMEFYDQITRKVPRGSAVLSGIVGDLFAGSVPHQKIGNAEQLIKLAYHHGVRADPHILKFNPDMDVRQKYWEEIRNKINEDFFPVLYLIRQKMTLLSYLLTVPEFYEFKVWSPFLQEDLCLGMLTLPAHRRKDRIWQKEFFVKTKCDLENMHLKTDRSNTLDSQAIRNFVPPPLDVDILSGVIQSSYVDEINRNLFRENFIAKTVNSLLTIPTLRWPFKKLGLENKQLKSYYAYVTLKPIENLLKKRNSHG
jgi:hypothetical protein